jgi:hypothetical protein
MADGLLLTRQERRRLFWGKFAGGVGPSAVLCLVAFLLGGGAVAVAIAIFGLLFGLLIATTAKTTRGALTAGIVCMVILFVFQLVVAWFVSHPILRE